MNSYQRVLKRLHGEPVDRIPNFDIMMQFAAHYVHEPLSHYYQDHRVLCAANLAVQQAFDLDIVQAISDPYREAADMGLDVEFPPDGLPLRKAPLIIEFDDIRKATLPPGGAGPRMTDRLAAVSLLRSQVGGQVPIMGWVEGAFAEAADIRGVSEVLMDIGDAPDWLTDLLERCAEVEIAFARAQVAAGADIIGLGDAIASQVSPSAYRAFALPYEQRIFAAVHDMGAIARLHICGNTTHLLRDMMKSGADIIDLDWMVDIGQAAALFGDNLPICGNFDPVALMLQGTPDAVRQATLDCAKRGGPRSISGAGCEIVDGSPVANLQAQAQTLRDYGMAA